MKCHRRFLSLLFFALSDYSQTIDTPKKQSDTKAVDTVAVNPLLTKAVLKESCIRIHKPLPNMRSAKNSETNGIHLGEKLKLQQQQIRELTLHLIEKDKQLIKVK